MPDLSQAQPVAFNCEGGLVLNRSAFLMQPGEALELENFEPDIEGGYRRISGFRKFVNQIVPQTSSSSEKILMVLTFQNKVLAARGEKIYNSASTELSAVIAADTGMTGSGTISVDSTTGFSSSGTLQINSEKFTYTGVTASTFTGVTRAASSTSAAAHVIDDVVSLDWTEIDSGRTNAVKYRVERFNFDGTDKIIVVDEANAPTVFNSSLSATDVSESSVAGSKFVAAYKAHMFYAGKSSSPANSCIVSPLIQPIFRVTGCIAKSEVVFPVNLNILFSQKINNESRKDFNPVIVSSTLILPAPLPVLKLSSSFGTLKTNSCGELDLPA